MTIGTIIGLSGLAGSGKDTVAGLIHDELSLRTARVSFADPLKELVNLIFEIPRDSLWGASSLRDIIAHRYDEEREWSAAEGRLYRHGPRWIHNIRGHDDEVAQARLGVWFERLRQTATTPCQLCMYEGNGCKTCDDSGRVGLTPRQALQTLGTEWGRGIDEDIWVDYALRRADSLLRGRDLYAVLITDVRFLNEARALRARNDELWLIERAGAGLPGAAGDHPSERDMRSPELRALATQLIDNDGTHDALRQSVGRLIREMRAVKR